MALVIVDPNFNYSQKMVLDTKDFDTLCNIISRATIVESKYTGNENVFVHSRRPDVIAGLFQSKIVSPEEYEAMRVQEEAKV